MNTKNELMKYTLMIFAFLIFATSAFSQNTKGFSVPKTAENNVTGKTYALIVGISKYRNPAIHSLQYADKDAVEFYQYLKASGVDTANMQLLLNENAKNSEIMLSIADISEKVQKGDKVIIYFSGHGDVESKVITQDAYLLAYDAPGRVYAGGGAIAVFLLKGYLETMSANGVEVIFISDACHAGNLSGGREGMENAAKVLKGEWKDEIKMLSCQPGELSLEGKQWGNGRGLFSYELIKGLAGDADKNKDGMVTMRELNLYLMEKVPDAANPMAQNPLLTGSMETIVSYVNNSYLTSYDKSEDKMIAAIDVKGFDDALVKKLPDSIQHFYAYFKKLLVGPRVLLRSEGFDRDGVIAIQDSTKHNAHHVRLKLTGGNGETAFEEIPDSMLHYYRECIMHYDSSMFTWYISKGKVVGKLFYSINRSKDYIVTAFDYYQKIPDNKDTKLLRSVMSRNLAAKNINIINDWIGGITNSYSAEIGTKNTPVGISKAEIESLIRILGRDKLYKMGVLPKVYYALASFNTISRGDSISYYNFSSEGMALLDSAINIDPYASYVYASKANKYYLYQKDRDNAIKYAKQAISISPNLYNCYTIIADCYSQPDSSVRYLNKLDSIIRRIPKADVINSYKPVFKLIKNDAFLHEEVQKFYFYPSLAICMIYASIDKKDSIQKYMDHISYKDPYIDSIKSIINAYCILGDRCADKKMYKYAIEFYLTAKGIITKYHRTDNWDIDYNIACTYSISKDKVNSIRYLEIALREKAHKYPEIKKDSELDYVRSTPEFKALMKKYFPIEYKE